MVEAQQRKHNSSEHRGPIGNRDIVLFLGAGFSTHAGVPLMGKFGEFSQGRLTSYKERHGPNSKDPKKSALRWIEAGETFHQFKDFCERGKTRSHVTTDNMETIFCMAEMLREAGDQHVRLNNRDCCPDYLLEQIRLWLWKIYNRCPPLIKEEEVCGQPYKRLMNLLHPIRQRLSVLTTNYDLIFEHFAWATDMPCDYGLVQFFDVARQQGDPDEHPLLRIFDQSAGSYLAPASDAARAPLVCKLHGSINFFEREVAPNRFQFGISDDLAPQGSRVGGSKAATECPAIFLVDAIWALRAKYGSSLIPAIVPPTYAKLQGHKWLRQIWGNALQALSQAKQIIFIGYSMPASDGFMQAMIQSAMAMRVLTEPPVITVIDLDKEEKTLDRYRNLFSPLDLKIGNDLRKMPFHKAVANGVLDEILGSERRGETQQ